MTSNSVDTPVDLIVPVITLPGMLGKKNAIILQSVLADNGLEYSESPQSDKFWEDIFEAHKYRIIDKDKYLVYVLSKQNGDQ